MKKHIVIHRDDRYYVAVFEDPENGVIVQLIREVVDTDGVSKQFHPLDTLEVRWTNVAGIDQPGFKKRVMEAVAEMKTKLAKRKERNLWIDGVFADLKSQEIEVDFLTKKPT